jgi:hypothetical protein
VLATFIGTKLQATTAVVQDRLDPNRHNKIVYHGKLQDSHVEPEGTIVEFTSDHAIKPVK